MKVYLLQNEDKTEERLFWRLKTALGPFQWKRTGEVWVREGWTVRTIEVEEDKSDRLHKREPEQEKDEMLTLLTIFWENQEERIEVDAADLIQRLEILADEFELPTPKVFRTAVGFSAWMRHNLHWIKETIDLSVAVKYDSLKGQNRRVFIFYPIEI